ncbi:hypothetical protein PM082_002341 [Marasmius tenuissimus]|nr:hypothetical protein PM082_002341 [Marasmius tenuissimus]
MQTPATFALRVIYSLYVVIYTARAYSSLPYTHVACACHFPEFHVEIDGRLITGACVENESWCEEMERTSTRSWMDEHGSWRKDICPAAWLLETLSLPSKLTSYNYNVVFYKADSIEQGSRTCLSSPLRSCPTRGPNYLYFPSVLGRTPGHHSLFYRPRYECPSIRHRQKVRSLVWSIVILKVSHRAVTLTIDYQTLWSSQRYFSTLPAVQRSDKSSFWGADTDALMNFGASLVPRLDESPVT